MQLGADRACVDATRRAHEGRSGVFHGSIGVHGFMIFERNLIVKILVEMDPLPGWRTPKLQAWGPNIRGTGTGTDTGTAKSHSQSCWTWMRRYSTRTSPRSVNGLVSW